MLFGNELTSPAEPGLFIIGSLGNPAKGLDINIYRYNVRDARDRRKKRTFYQPSTKSSCISESIRGIDDQKQKRLIISRRHTYNRQLNLIGGR
jgi:hypothetical protein